MNGNLMNNTKSIPEQLKIFSYDSYEDIPAAKKAWITIKAKQYGKDPKMVHAGIKARMKNNTHKSISSEITTEKSIVIKKKKSNMYELSLKQWNPFVGCGFDCIYCKTSFQRQAKRQKHRCSKCYRYIPHTHPNRLNSSLPKTSKDEFIFTCSSGDISFCSTSFLKKIIEKIEGNPNKTFLIQSKDPKTFNRVNFPDNVILGITLETNRDNFYRKVSKAPKPTQRIKDFLKIKHLRKMITIEPIMDFDCDVMLKWIKQIKPQLVWMGYDSKNKKLIPEPSLEKFMDLYKALGENGIKVKMKTVRAKL